MVSVTPDTVCAAKVCDAVRGGVNVSVPVIVPPFTVPENDSVPLKKPPLPFGLAPSVAVNDTLGLLKLPLVIVKLSPV